MSFWEFQKFCQKNSLVIFTINDLKLLYDQYSSGYLLLKIARWKRKGYLQTLRRGLYLLADAKVDEFEIAAKLVIPSYISLEAALSHYSLIPEVAAAVTSLTTKNTRVYIIRGNRYQFYHLQEKLFFGFKHLRNGVFIALPEKAILDFFYFRNPGKDDPFFTRLNNVVVKDLDLAQMRKFAGSFPKYVQNLLTYFIYASTH